MGTSNPAGMAGWNANRESIAPGDLEAMVNAAVADAVSGALSGKADLVGGTVPDTQLPSRLSDAQIASVAGNAAASAVTDALDLRNLPAPAHASSVALGSTTTAEAQIAGGARHLELKPSTAPAAPSTGGRLWVESIAGKNTLRVIFPTGGAITLATEP